MRMIDYFDVGTPAVLIVSGQMGISHGKTAYGLLRHSRVLKPVCVLDEFQAGKRSVDFVPDARYDVPILSSISQAMEYEPKVAVIAVASIGGYLPDNVVKHVKEAIQNGLDIVSGLHRKISEDPEFVELARKSGSRLVDVRVPPKELRILDGSVLNRKAYVVDVLGTDCVIGKRTTAVQLRNEFERLGVKAGFIATGQTGIMIGADEGVVLDAVPADFVAGVMEDMIKKVDMMNEDIIFVEGQAAVLHPAYGHVTLGLLYGSMPDAVILVHDPFRKRLSAFENFEMIDWKQEREILERLGKTKVIAISVLNDEGVEIMRKETDLPVGNPLTEEGLKVLSEAVKSAMRDNVRNEMRR